MHVLQSHDFISCVSSCCLLIISGAIVFSLCVTIFAVCNVTFISDCFLRYTALYILFMFTSSVVGFSQF
jgi:hypothetical protein